MGRRWIRPPSVEFGWLSSPASMASARSAASGTAAAVESMQSVLSRRSVVCPLVMRLARFVAHPRHACARSKRAGRWLLLLLLSLIYLLPGLVGHDPWKQDETYVTSIIYHLAQTEDWIVPHSAGVPFVEKPPLYFLVAEEAADLLAPWLPLHDAARLVNVLWMLIVLGCLALAAAHTWPQAANPSAAAVLTLLSCIGLVVDGHLLVVDVALLAGFALALLGLCLIRDQPVRGGLLLGTGVGLGFLAKGLLAPGCLGATALLLPALFAPWRTRAYARGLAIAAIVALPWLIVWPAALYLRAPELFAHWLWQQNVGRFLGYAHLGAEPVPWYYAKTLPWFAFPALPLALWTLWRRRALWRHDPTLQLAVVRAVVILATLSIAGSMRALYLF